MANKNDKNLRKIRKGIIPHEKHYDINDKRDRKYAYEPFHIPCRSTAP